MRLICLCSMLIFSLITHAAPSQTQMSVWVNEAIIATYTYDYKNYTEEQKQIAKYFSADGWIAYNKALDKANLIETIKKNAYYVTSVATNPPEIKPIDASHWQATMPILVSYKNPQYQQQQHLNISIQFATAPSGQGVRGYYIVSLQSKETSPPCTCSHK